jgi:hypothetical protein
MAPATLLILGLYAVTVIGALVVLRARRPSSLERQNRFTTMAGLAAVGIMAGALFWRVPVVAQQRVDAAASLSPVPALPQVSCDVLLKSLAGLGRMSNDELTITPKGEIVADEAVWRRVPEEYRRMLVELASRAVKCAAAGEASSDVLVRNKNGGEAYERIPLAG